MNSAVEALGRALHARDQGRAETAAIDVGRAALDIELRYRPPAEIDLARFELWARRLIVDAQANNLGWVNGDIASLEWTRDRLAASLEPADLARINSTRWTQNRGLSRLRARAHHHRAPATTTHGLGRCE
jgi:hypothetical protein